MKVHERNDKWYRELEQDEEVLSTDKISYAPPMKDRHWDNTDHSIGMTPATANKERRDQNDRECVWLREIDTFLGQMVDVSNREMSNETTQT